MQVGLDRPVTAAAHAGYRYKFPKQHSRSTGVTGLVTIALFASTLLNRLDSTASSLCSLSEPCKLQLSMTINYKGIPADSTDHDHDGQCILGDWFLDPTQGILTADHMLHHSPIQIK